MNVKEQQGREEGIDVIELLQLFWSQKIILIIFMVVCALFMYIKTYFFTIDTYTASGILYVSNKPEDMDESKISKTDIDTSRVLSTTYIEILRTSFFMEEVGRDVGGYSWQDIYSMTSFSTVNNTELLRISVRARNGMEAYQIAKTILEKAPKKLKSVYKSGESEIVDPPRVPTKPNSKGVARKTIIGGFTGLGIGAVLVFIASFFDTKVRKGEDAAKRYKVSILGELSE